MEETNKKLLQANGNIKRNIIYIDPPWKLEDAICEYETLSQDDLKKMDIPALADDDCMLFIWATGCTLHHAIELIGAWGFRYTSMYLVWGKQKDGYFHGGYLGPHSKQVCEFLLLGIKGSVMRYQNQDAPTLYNLLLEDRREHSQKPTTVRDILDFQYYNVPKIEIFARDSSNPNWDYFGNESDKYGVDTNPEEIKKLRAAQQQMVKDLKECKRIRGDLVDPNNRYGAKRNNQKTLDQYLKKVKRGSDDLEEISIVSNLEPEYKCMDCTLEINYDTGVEIDGVFLCDQCYKSLTVKMNEYQGK